MRDNQTKYFLDSEFGFCLVNCYYHVDSIQQSFKYLDTQIVQPNKAIVLPISSYPLLHYQVGGVLGKVTTCIFLETLGING
jgi:hypothetical protein